jgi:hypothetical protein
VLVTAALFAAAGCGSLDRSVVRNECATSSDCNPGRVCVAGICQARTDAAGDTATDAPAQDTAHGNDAGVEAARDLPAASEAGAEAPDTSRAEAGIDAPDAPAGGDVDAGVDAGDAPADSGLGLDAARDTGVPPPPDPCTTGPGQESPVSTSALLAALPGLWRQCPTSTTVDPDVSWLVGSTRVVQLDARHWGRCTDGQPPSCGAMAQGLYFRVLEGSNSVFHFADSVDPLNGGGADLSIHYFAGSKLLQITACDGASLCSNNTAYLVFVGPAPGS